MVCLTVSQMNAVSIKLWDLFNNIQPGGLSKENTRRGWLFYERDILTLPLTRTPPVGSQLSYGRRLCVASEIWMRPGTPGEHTYIVCLLQARINGLLLYIEAWTKHAWRTLCRGESEPIEQQNNDERAYLVLVSDCNMSINLPVLSILLAVFIVSLHQ